ncbi:hypothetical protein [Kribbella sp. NPDC004536]|uniref:hypothetical protein n=1 Tax=Kribbella sp. NPDC004536 TaxID=3364106 RepID=UPI0036BC339C
MLRIFEHVDADLGRSCLDRAVLLCPEFGAIMDRFRRNDVIGRPEVVSYGVYGELSPSTCRYVKTLAELADRFGSLDGLTVVEIGGGYGGQALVTHEVFQPERYALIDLDEALELQRAYLTASDVGGCFEFVAADDFQAAPAADLVISSYALTECYRDAALGYGEKYVVPSPRGYIVGNQLMADRLYPTDLLRLRSTGHLDREVPQSAAGNYVFWWNDAGI